MRLRGLGLGRVGMEKVKNSHKGRVVRKFRRRGCVVRNFRTREGVVRVLCENLSFLWFSKTESIHFLKLAQKQICTRDVLCENFAQQEVLCENC